MSKHFSDSNVRANPSIVFKSDTPVPVICVAATYTGVTYANNGGKVQLSSAGVHGLTTSPAVGASVYVSWASGTGVSGLYNVNSVDDTLKITIEYPYAVGLGTPTVAILNTYIEVATIALPTLTDSSKIRCGARVSCVASASTKSIFFSFGGTTDAAGAATATATHNTLRLESGYIEITGKNGSVWDFIGTYITIATGGSGVTYRSGNIASLSGQGVKILLRTSAANDVISMQSYLVEVFI